MNCCLKIQPHGMKSIIAMDPFTLNISELHLFLGLVLETYLHQNVMRDSQYPITFVRFLSLELHGLQICCSVCIPFFMKSLYLGFGQSETLSSYFFLFLSGLPNSILYLTSLRLVNDKKYQLTAANRSPISVLNKLLLTAFPFQVIWNFKFSSPSL